MVRIVCQRNSRNELRFNEKKTATNVALKQKIKWTALLTNYYPSGSATFSSSALAVVPIV